jgi:hypothetical protein
MIEEEPRPVPSKGWAEMIRKVYELDPHFVRGRVDSEPDAGDPMPREKRKFLL